MLGDYSKAKEFFRECLKQQPSEQIKGMVLNNLAMAYYWQKFSNLDQPERLKKYKRDSDEMIEKEIATVPALLKDAIKNLEGSLISSRCREVSR